MNTVTIDNSDNGDILRAILWQYEHANNIVGVIETFKAAYDASTRDFFDALLSRYNLANENIGAFGLAVWGVILSLPRPYLEIGGNGAMLSDSMYRKILLGKLRLLDRDITMASYQEFCDLVFGEGKVEPQTDGEMDLSFSAVSGATLTDEETAVLDAQADLFAYPSGVKSNEHSNSLMFGFDGQQDDLQTGDPEVGGLDESSFCWRYTKNGNWN